MPRRLLTVQLELNLLLDGQQLNWHGSGAARELKPLHVALYVSSAINVRPPLCGSIVAKRFGGLSLPSKSSCAPGACKGTTADSSSTNRRAGSAPLSCQGDC
jgi:hypothetical protein